MVQKSELQPIITSPGMQEQPIVQRQGLSNDLLAQQFSQIRAAHERAGEPIRLENPSRWDYEQFLDEWLSDPASADAFDPDLLHEIESAVRILRKNPSIFSGDPQNIFTYEHRTLALGLELYKGGVREGITGGRLVSWVGAGLSALRSMSSQAFIEIAARTPGRPIRLIGEDGGLGEGGSPVQIAILGDAGISCEAQDRVIRLMKERCQRRKYSLIIHLGDIYFAGSPGESLTNLLAPLLRMPGRMHLSLLGNHDLYAGAEAYLAIMDVLKQPGRYFSINVGKWRIACLDTALAARVPFRLDGLLDRAQLTWLENLADTLDNRRLILMGHHPPVSAWETESEDLSRQIHLGIQRKTAAWYWGHEHRCAAYAPNENGWVGGLIGNGAIQTEWSEPTNSHVPLEWYPTSHCRCYPGRHGPRSDWPHGYLELTVHEDSLEEVYLMETGEQFVRTIRV